MGTDLATYPLYIFLKSFPLQSWLILTQLKLINCLFQDNGIWFIVRIFIWIGKKDFFYIFKIEEWNCCNTFLSQLQSLIIKWFLSSQCEKKKNKPLAIGFWFMIKMWLESYYNVLNSCWILVEYFYVKKEHFQNY